MVILSQLVHVEWRITIISVICYKNTYYTQNLYCTTTSYIIYYTVKHGTIITVTIHFDL